MDSSAEASLGRSGRSGIFSLMNSDRHRRVSELVNDALACPAEQREALIVRLCGGDAELRSEVQQLVRLADAPGDPFGETALRGNRQRVVELLDARDRGSSAETRTLASRDIESVGHDATLPDHIGPYRILSLLGQGGMGRVFLAQQEQPRRQVAVKILRHALAGERLRQRFAFEAETLARLEHEGIARIYAAGAADVVGRGEPNRVLAADQPFLAMEYIDGEPLDQHVQRVAMSVHERLRLFVRICAAVNYAHTKGVIHRDLKPRNILVTGDGVPKVLDFGIARAVDDGEEEGLTHTGHPIGTPAYMSPEQAEGSRDIDTRTDVYALGVVLYQLLTGVTPFDPQPSTQGVSLSELQRRIREVDPPRPSTLISAESSVAGSVLGGRSADWRKVRSTIQGELDWIVLKTLEKGRARRYESAGALADDVRRFLTGDAVNAAPPSTSYRLRKFLRRRRGPVAAVAAVGLALLLGVVGFAWQAQVAGYARDRAVKAEAETQQRADELQKVADFQGRMLERINPASAGLELRTNVTERLEDALRKTGLSDEDRAAELEEFSQVWSRVNATDTAVDLIKTTILQPAMEGIDRQFAEQPLLKARLKHAIGKSFVDLGLGTDALSAIREALALRREVIGEDAPETIETILAECKILKQLGRSTESEAISRPLLDRLRERLPANDPLIFAGQDVLGECLLITNRFAEAESLLRSAYDGRRRVLGEDHELTLQSGGNLALALRGTAKYAEAESVAADGLQRRLRLYGEDSPYVLSSRNNLATIRVDAGQFQLAADGFREVVEGRRRIQGEVHPDTLNAQNNYAATLSRLGKHEESVALHRDVLERLRRILGPDYPDTRSALSNLAVALINLGKFDEAEPLCLELVERQARIAGERSVDAIKAYNVLGFLYSRQKKFVQVEECLQKALDASLTAWGEDHPERLVLIQNMGVLKRNLGQVDDSEQILRDVLERYKQTLGMNHPNARTAYDALAETLLVAKKYEESMRMLTDIEPAARAAFAKSDSGDLRFLLLRLGKTQSAAGLYSDAEKSLLEAYELYVVARGPTGRATIDCARLLAELYQSWHAAEPSSGHDAKAAEWTAKLEAASQPSRSAP